MTKYVPTDRRPLDLLRQIEALQERIDRTIDAAELRDLTASMHLLRAEQRAIGDMRKRPAKRNRMRSAKLPRSIRDEMKAERERAHAISGLRSVRVQFVQGGKGGS
jgi:hypothetical protein